MEAEEGLGKRKKKRRHTQDSSSERSSRHCKHSRVDGSPRLSQAEKALKEKLESCSDEELKELHALKDGSENLLGPPSALLSPDLEKALWKAHHSRIADFRSHMQRAAEKQKCSKVSKKTLKNVVTPFIEFIASSSNFYMTLLSKVRMKHGLCAIVSDKNNDLEDTKFRVSHSICHRLLMRLGDLARYKEVYGVSLGKRDYSTAESYYLEASKLCHCEGGPHSQLAILATHTGNKIRAVYHYIRSMFAKIPSPTSHNNLLILLDSKADSASDMSERVSTFDNLFAVFNILLRKTGFTDLQKLLEGALSELEVSLLASTDEFGAGANVVIAVEAEKQKALQGIQIVTILIACIQDFHLGVICKTPQPRSVLLDSLASAFKLVRMLAAINASAGTMLPALVVFTTWLAGCEDIVKVTVEMDELRRSFLDALDRAESFFQLLSLSSEDESFGRFWSSEDGLSQGGSSSCALWEDHELQGFVLLSSNHENMDFGVEYQTWNTKHLNWIRLRRLEASLSALAKMAGLTKDLGTFSAQALTPAAEATAVPSPTLPSPTLNSNLDLDSQLAELRLHMNGITRLSKELSRSMGGSFLATEFLSISGSFSQKAFKDLSMLDQLPSFSGSLDNDRQRLTNFEEEIIPEEICVDVLEEEDEEEVEEESQTDSEVLVAPDALHWKTLYECPLDRRNCLDEITHVVPVGGALSWRNRRESYARPVDRYQTSNPLTPWFHEPEVSIFTDESTD